MFAIVVFFWLKKIENELATASLVTVARSLVHTLSLSCIRRNKQGHYTAHMHVTACLAGQKVDVEVGEDCRTLHALKESIGKELPQLCVEGFDVSVGGRALDDDEGVVSLQDSTCLDVVPSTCSLSVLALREAGREVSEVGLLAAVRQNDVALCTLYLDAGVPPDCVDGDGKTPLHLSCFNGDLKIATLLLDRGSNAIDEKDGDGETPLFLSCFGHLEIATLLLDRGSTAIDEKEDHGDTPLLLSCRRGELEIATLLLDRGSTAIDEKDGYGKTPLLLSCYNGHLEVATLLLDRGSTAIDEKDSQGSTPLLYSCWHGNLPVSTLLLNRGSNAIYEKNRTGKTPLHLSWDNGHLSVATLLLTEVAKRLIRRTVMASHLFSSSAAAGT